MSDPQPVYLSDYQPPDYQVTHTELTFDLDPTATRVKARLTIERHAQAAPQAPLVLNGEHLTLRSLELDGRPLADESTPAAFPPDTLSDPHSDGGTL